MDKYVNYSPFKMTQDAPAAKAQSTQVTWNEKVERPPGAMGHPGLRLSPSKHTSGLKNTWRRL